MLSPFHLLPSCLGLVFHLVPWPHSVLPSKASKASQRLQQSLKASSTASESASVIGAHCFPALPWRASLAISPAARVTMQLAYPCCTVATVLPSLAAPCCSPCCTLFQAQKAFSTVPKLLFGTLKPLQLPPVKSLAAAPTRLSSENCSSGIAACCLLFHLQTAAWSGPVAQPPFSSVPRLLLDPPQKPRCSSHCSSGVAAGCLLASFF